MPWGQLEGWNNIRKQEYYDVYAYKADATFEIEIYKLDYIPSNDAALYDFRLRNTHPFIPQILDVIPPQGGKEVFTKVIMEHTPMRLDECRSLPNRPIELIVAEVFIGFEAIFRMVGPLKVRENMVGFDKEGNPKVWLNFNFAKNHRNPFDVLKAHRQNIMVKNLLDIFEPFGYSLEVEPGTFEDTKKLVLDNLMNKTVERGLINAAWKPKLDFKHPTVWSSDKSKHKPSTPIYQHKTSQQKPSQFTRASQKKPLEYQSKVSNKSGKVSSRPVSEEFGVAPHPMTNEFEAQVPTFIDEANVIGYLGNPLHMLDNKLMFISYLKQNPITDRVSDISNVFEFAIVRDPELYSTLLQLKGNIQRNTSPFFQAKIKKIKEAYSGLATYDHVSSNFYYETAKQPYKGEVPTKQYKITNVVSESLEVKFQGGYEQNHNHRMNKISGTSRQEDLIQSFDKALQKFVLQKGKVRPQQSQPLHSQQSPQYIKKSVPIQESMIAQIANVKNMNGSQRWDNDTTRKEVSIEEKQKIKQKSFAGLKEEAARVLGL